MSNSTILFTVCSLFYSILLLFVEFRKEKNINFKNQIFKGLVIANFIGIIIEIIYFFIPMDAKVFKFIFSRCFFIYLLTWITMLILYVFAISYNKKGKSDNQLKSVKRKSIKISCIVLFVLSMLVILLPLYDNVEKVYSYGPSANLVYYASEVYVIIGLLIMFLNHNKINKNHAPFFIYIAGGAIVMILQSMHPEWLLMTSMETFITYLIFFNIQNDDVSKKIEKK